MLNGVLGATGIDGTELLPEPTSPPITNINAILGMRDALLSQPKGEAWVVATGALTNIGLLFATFPELATHIKGLSVMGGAIGDGFTSTTKKDSNQPFGNTTYYAEFNVYVRIIDLIAKPGTNAEEMNSAIQKPVTQSSLTRLWLPRRLLYHWT